MGEVGEAGGAAWRRAMCLCEMPHGRRGSARCKRAAASLQRRRGVPSRMEAATARCRGPVSFGRCGWRDSRRACKLHTSATRERPVEMRPITWPPNMALAHLLAPRGVWGQATCHRAVSRRWGPCCLRAPEPCR